MTNILNLPRKINYKIFCCFENPKSFCTFAIDFGFYFFIYGNSSNNNAYDLDIINYICDVYIDLCYEYDKEISILGFSKLTGINQDTFYDWGNGSSRPSSIGCEIYKKLSREREESLSNMLISGKRNPVGLLGALNRHYGWNMGQPRGATGEQKQSIEQIQERYRLEQGAEKPLIEPPKADF